MKWRNLDTCFPVINISINVNFCYFQVRSDQDSNHVCILDEDDAWLYEKSDCLRNDKNICEWT